MVGSLILGWVFVILGVVIVLVALWERIQERRARSSRLESIAEVRDTVEALAKLTESFSKFSENIQFLLIGAGMLIAGIYLLSSRPF